MATIKIKFNFKKNLYEKKAQEKNILVCGVDEVGRGCLAGPVVASAAVIFSKRVNRLIKDSKSLSPDDRLKAYDWITKNGVFATGILNHRLIDRFNIYQATILAMKRAVAQLLLKVNISMVLVDSIPLKLDNFNGDIIAFDKGESKSSSIAAASIIAKVTRDRIMERLSNTFPGYKFEKNKGYATRPHLCILDSKISLIHRKSFIKNLQSLDDVQLNIFGENDETDIW